MRKLKKIKSILQEMGSVLVAYSGGADSTFLLKVARDVLGDKVLAVTANSPTYPASELVFAKESCRALGVRHKIISTRELDNENFARNPVNRCYFCKNELFRSMKEIARKNKINFVIDASNISDKSDFRPGSIAKKKLGVRSPLEEAGITKDDLRRLSKKMGLDTWDKPALACLASRIPYGTRITPSLLKRIDQSEGCLKRMGFTQVRLRHYNGLCRIEVPKAQIRSLIDKGNQIIDKLKKFGYNYITVDLEGYRTGSLNPAFIKRNKLGIKRGGASEVIKR